MTISLDVEALAKKKSGRIAVGKTKEKCVIRGSVWFRVSVLT